jgi:hypothetical protein
MLAPPIASAVVGIGPHLLYTTPFAGEDEAEATSAAVHYNWLRVLDTAVLEASRRREFDSGSSRRVRAYCMAAWVAVRGELDTPAAACLLEALSAPAPLPSLDACVGLAAPHAPVGLATLVHYLAGAPTQATERVVVGPGDIGVYLAAIPGSGGSSSGGSASPGAWPDTAAEASLLMQPVCTHNPELHCHTLADMMTAFVNFVDGSVGSGSGSGGVGSSGGGSSGGIGSSGGGSGSGSGSGGGCTNPPAKHKFLDCLGSLLHLCHTSTTHYSNAWETFPDAMLAEDHKAHHAPIIIVWSVLLRACKDDAPLKASVLALYALLRPSVTAKIYGEAERNLTRQMEALVLFSIVGTLFPPAPAPESPSILTSPSWFYGLHTLTEEMHTYVAGVHHMWALEGLELQTSYCRLVMETQCQLPLLVLRRGKCCYSNALVSSLW